MFYDIHYNCPECIQSHLATTTVGFDESDLAGLPLTEVYYPDEINELLCKIVECPSTKNPISLETSRFFLTITDSLKYCDATGWAEANELPMAAGGIYDEE